MVRTYAYSANFDKELEKLFREAKFLGEGHNGIVYELPEDKAVKIFTNKDICREEAKIKGLNIFQEFLGVIDIIYLEKWFKERDLITILRKMECLKNLC